MGDDRPTPQPRGWTCPEHSGMLERIRDLEGRAAGATGERNEMRKDIVDIKVSMARIMTIAGVVIVVVNALVVLGVKALGG